MIKLKLEDGNVVLASHIIKIDKKITTELIPLQVDSEGVICYTEDDLDMAKLKLDELGIKYNIKEIDNKEAKKKAKGIKYRSRTEAINHLEKGVESKEIKLERLLKVLGEGGINIEQL